MSGKLFFYSCLVNISITWKCRWTFHFPMSCKHFLYLWQVNFSPTWVHKQSLQQVLFARVVADGEATQLLYVVPPLGFFCQTLPDLIQGLPIKHIKEFNGEHIKLIEVMIVQFCPLLRKLKVSNQLNTCITQINVPQNTLHKVKQELINQQTCTCNDYFYMP